MARPLHAEVRVLIQGDRIVAAGADVTELANQTLLPGLIEGHSHLFLEEGAVRPGLLADLIAVEGNPTEDVRVLRQIRFAVKGGAIIAN
ncbi:MAG TPA: hypothetical protein VNR40_14780 [Steroidobacter sp.]|nr:hypothetical protein [Steroidobacter sp.]